MNTMGIFSALLLCVSNLFYPAVETVEPKTIPMKTVQTETVQTEMRSGATSHDQADETNWIGKSAPEISEGKWINSKPLKLSELRGKVVLLEFWTFGCYNCRNTLPQMNAWYKKFSAPNFNSNLQMIGIHTPEFSREKNFESLGRETALLEIKYPVVTDNDNKTWNTYNQQYWPVVYLIDKKGVIRYAQIGEGRYAETEAMIETLLKEN